MFGLQTAGAGLFARLLPIAVETKYHTRLRLPPNRPPHLVQLHCALEQTSDESHPGLPGRHRKLPRQQTGAGCSGQRAQAPLTTGWPKGNTKTCGRLFSQKTRAPQQLPPEYRPRTGHTQATAQLRCDAEVHQILSRRQTLSGRKIPKWFDTRAMEESRAGIWQGKNDWS